MDNNWMIFYNQSSLEHWLYNGKSCIGIDNKSIDFEPDDAEDAVLHLVNNHRSKRVFELKGAGKYTVVARGEFVTQ